MTWRIRYKKNLAYFGPIFFCLLLFLLGIRFLLIPSLVFINLFFLRLPRITNSWLSRLVVSSVLVFSLLQLAAAIQFLILPNSGFKTIATIVALINLLILVFYGTVISRRLRLVNRQDACAILVCLFFVLPIAAVTLRAGLNGVAKVSSSQTVDAENHYVTIEETTQTQHFDYKYNGYYPKGFHIATAFTENSFFGQLSRLSWRTNAYIFFGQYLFWGSILAYGVYYLCIAWMSRWVKQGSWRILLFLSLALGPSLALFYLVPYMKEGFINYYFVSAAFVYGLIFISELAYTPGNFLKKFIKNRTNGWFFLAFYILAFAAGVSWPLLLPAFALIPILIIWPNNFNDIRNIFKSKLSWLTILIALLIQLIPIYFQLKYSPNDPKQGLNTVGDLRVFHGLVVLAGILLVLIASSVRSLDIKFRKIIVDTFLPLIGFIGLLAFYQLAKLGEIRYFVIKSSMLFETLSLALGVVLLAYLSDAWQLTRIKYFFFVVFLPLAIILTMVSSEPNPMKNDRDLLRFVIGQNATQQYNHDVSSIVKLGSEGKIKHFNIVVLHVDQNQKLSGLPDLTYWASSLQYAGNSSDKLSQYCHSDIYANLEYGAYTSAEQQKLVSDIFRCAHLSNERGQNYYMVTDRDSAQKLSSIFNKSVSMVY